MTEHQLTSTSAIVTYSGRIIDPLHPRPENIWIEDIAHSLSNQCRFTGHTKRFYSVAEHSVRVAEVLPDEHKLAGLLHDASEAYLSDLARPIKQHSALGLVYREIEEGLMAAIGHRLGFELPLSDEVKEADGELLKAEIRDLMPANDDERLLDYDDVSLYSSRSIMGWTPGVARKAFLMTFREVTPF